LASPARQPKIKPAHQPPRALRGQPVEAPQLGFNRGFNRFGFNRGFNSRFARSDRFHHFRHFRNRFAFVGGGWDWGYPYDDYAAYGDGCWRQVWTSYGWQWSNTCYNYGY
jgi:hypothetical protein